jgi:hypothetical protein
MAFEPLGTHAYRVGVVYLNRQAAMFSDTRDFNSHGVALLHAKGHLIMPPAAGAMNPSLPVANVRTFRISLAWLVVITAILPLIFGPRWVLKTLRTHRAEHCRRCGYNLTGNTSGTCPECGSPISTSVMMPDTEKRPA